MIEFRYREERSRLTGTVLRPVADVHFRTTDGEWIEAHPYIDSGADITLIPLSFGQLLGLEVVQEEIDELRGIGEGAVSMVVCQVPLRIGDQEFEARVAWALIEEVPLLLGRLDVFERFSITFEEAERKILFEPR